MEQDHEAEESTTSVRELRQQIDELKELNDRLQARIEILQESEAKYEAIVEAFDGFVYICSSHYEIEFMNEKLIERTGRNAAGDKCNGALHDLENVCPWCVNERVFGGETVRWEVLSPKDNRWYSIVNTPLRHKDGSLSKMAMIHDITERKLSEEKTRQQNEFVTHVLESLTHPFYVIDANNYRILMANSAAHWESTSEKTTCYALTHGRKEPCNCSQHPCPIREVKKTRKPVTVEHVHQDKDGNARNVEVHAYPVFDTKGNVSQILEYGLDITERKRAEEDRDKLIRQLRASNDDLKMFGCAVSHDLRSPLITIRGFLPIIKRDTVSGNLSRLGESLRVVDTAAAKMESLLDELGELSLIGQIQELSQELSVGEIAQEVIGLLAIPIAESNARVEIASNLPTLYGDRSRLLQVVQNLLENAIKFRDEKKRLMVTIGSRQDREGTVIFVRDNGIGIDPCDQQAIFGLFDRIDRRIEGTGFGLALVKRIVEAHGGRIWIESAGVGHGSTFCFTWPKGIDQQQDDLQLAGTSCDVDSQHESLVQLH